MSKDPRLIIDLISEKKGIDFSGYHLSLVEGQIQNRVEATACANYSEYLKFAEKNPEEVSRLVDGLTINVSHFFRNALTFEMLMKVVLPRLISKKRELNIPSLRVWSAGCSNGEEPYSMAILIKELLRKETLSWHLNIFATDIDEKAITKSRAAIYAEESVKNVKYYLLKKYFLRDNELFLLKNEIKDQVNFSFHDITSGKHSVPSESVFGGFDIVLCRNVLIYLKEEVQNRVFERLYRALVPRGILVLGESETPIKDYEARFKRIDEFCHLYQKNEN